MKPTSAARALHLLVIPMLLVACSKPSASPTGTGVDAQAAKLPDAAAAEVPEAADAAPAAPTPLPATDASVAQAEPPAPEPGPAAGHMALIVSFYSPGNGTDHEAYERLEAIVRDTRPEPARTRRAWGREGEHDECFTLAELTPAARKAFIARVRKEVGKSKRVNILVDQPCRAPRD